MGSSWLQLQDAIKSVNGGMGAGVADNIPSPRVEGDYVPVLRETGPAIHQSKQDFYSPDIKGCVILPVSLLEQY